METLVGFIFLMGIVYYLYLRAKEEEKEEKRAFVKAKYFPDKKNEKRSSFTQMSQEDIENEASRIAANIKTHKGIENLEDKISNLSDKLDQYNYDDNETMYNKVSEKIDVLEMARDYAYDNPYRYYYDEGYPDINTPIPVLKNAGKLISTSDYENLDEHLKSYYEVITIGEVETNEEAKEIAIEAVSEYKKEIKDIIAVMSVIDSEIIEEEKEKQFNKIVSSSEFLMEELDLNKDDDLSLYKQYSENSIYNEKVENLYPLPHAWIFVENDFETLDEIKALSDDDLLSLSGIGSKRLKDIREYLNSLS